MVNLGRKSVGVLELTALPSISKDRWVPLVQEIDVLLVAGGDAFFLNNWMRQVRTDRPLSIAAGSLCGNERG